MTLNLPIPPAVAVTTRCPHCATLVPLSANGDQLLRIASHQMPGGGGVCPESGKVLGRLQENRDER